jgi:D-inositol-3-phosphate glycosyltransferase
MAIRRSIDPAVRPRVAVISLHSSPQDQPGAGDSGGMNVYIREVTQRLADRGFDVDVFTRCAGRGGPTVLEAGPGNRIIQVQAGPCASVAKDHLPRLVPAFLGGILERQREDGARYDLVHSHYWLSGRVGDEAKAIWGVPLVASFHSLGRVKNRALARDEDPEPEARLEGEQEVVATADRILAPTPAEAMHLVDLYGADPDRIRVVPAGVDHQVFTPRPREEARRRVGLTGSRVVLFVGRLQPHKGPDVAIRALAEAVARDPARMRGVVLVVVGGPSGRTAGGGEMAGLVELAAALGVGDRVVFLPPQPQLRLADFYAGAEAVLVPSRTESFGLVALEAQACGTPVIAADTGGLRYVVRDGVTGFLVPGHDPADYADRMLTVLSDRVGARRMGDAAAANALGYSWDATASGVLEVYREVLLPERRAAVAAGLSGDDTDESRAVAAPGTP